MKGATLGVTALIVGKKYLPGALVEVDVSMDGQTKNVTSKFNGQTFRIEYRHQPKPTVKPQFTLVGCESEYGQPYWFTEEDLILI